MSIAEKPRYFGQLSSVEEILEDARQGRMFILVDAEDRENEGDLVIPAQTATPEAINFMARLTSSTIALRRVSVSQAVTRSRHFVYSG
jgi:3,4-dihydroxy-2-butanone 4-phosphate synthase